MHGILDADKLDIEHEGCPSRYHATRPAVAIAVLGCNLEDCTFAHLHGSNTKIPPLNDLTFTQWELQWLPAITGGVKLRAVL